jgi:hypothetical protein
MMNIPRQEIKRRVLTGIIAGSIGAAITFFANQGLDMQAILHNPATTTGQVTQLYITTGKTPHHHYYYSYNVHGNAYAASGNGSPAVGQQVLVHFDALDPSRATTQDPQVVANTISFVARFVFVIFFIATSIGSTKKSGQMAPDGPINTLGFERNRF